MHDLNTRHNIYVFAQTLASTFEMMKQEELPHHGGVLGVRLICSLNARRVRVGRSRLARDSGGGQDQAD